VTVASERRGTTSFESIKKSVLLDGHRSHADNLKGMKQDFDYYLSQIDGIVESSLEIRRTSDPEGLLMVECRAASTVEAALDEAERVWTDRLCYSYIEAHHSSVLPDGSAQLRFVTQMDKGGMYVTGTVTIRK